MKPVGYTALIETYGLDVLVPALVSHIHEKSQRRSIQVEGRQEEYYPGRYDPGSTWQDQLLFALKHEGVNLEILAALFRTLSDKDLIELVRSAPTGRYVRQAWFLFEWLFDRHLGIPDLDQGNYVHILDPERYFAPGEGQGARRVRRQRVIDNLPGTREWCPLVRKTDSLLRHIGNGYSRMMGAKLASYSPEVQARASQYLYLKETKSSWELEHLTADSRRSARFMELLRTAGSLDLRSESALVRIQNAIVDERFAATGFRKSQNYVGQSLASGREHIHFVPPRPDDLPSLMGGWAQAWERMEYSGLDPVIVAAVAGFGFVFLHPFDDGNGRLHRFIIHHALAIGGFTPQGFVFPVSATMLAKLHDYDACLESYSREIGLHVEYRLDAHGGMEVLNDTLPWYRYPDLTVQAEALFCFIRDTIDGAMAEELDYLAAYDKARTGMRAVVDLPDRSLDLFIRLCLQNKGRLSASKRSLFEELDDDEIQRLEQALAESDDRAYGQAGNVPNN
jgi:hypothetical protein